MERRQLGRTNITVSVLGFGGAEIGGPMSATPLQVSVSIADQEAIDLILPLALQRRIGIIAKRPIANVAWRESRKPSNPYRQVYWRRLRKLDFAFLKKGLAQGVETALRFTLSSPGVHVAIVGTTKPWRWSENAKMIKQGPLAASQYETIRQQWRQAARPGWNGQT